jgi:hypothetical protein
MIFIIAVTSCGWQPLDVNSWGLRGMGPYNGILPFEETKSLIQETLQKIYNARTTVAVSGVRILHLR